MSRIESHLRRARWRRASWAIVFAIVFAVPASATGSLGFGAGEDATKYADDGGAALFQRMRDLGMTENRVTVFWNANQPSTLQEAGFLDRMIPVASRLKIKIVFSVQPQPAIAFVANEKMRIALFADFLGMLARRYPSVREFVIGNEPNERLFLQPQHGPDGTIRSAATYEAILAASYDALKAVDRDIQVAGLALSPDGNDGKPGSDNESVSPVRFIAAVGDAYRASARVLPIMDSVDMHIYAAKNNWSLVKPRRWPNAGGADLDRIKQAFWDAFHGTGQPVFLDAAAPDSRGPRVDDFPPVRFRLDETATQVAIDPAKVPPALYSGKENVPTVDEETQARYYRELIARVKCDPSVDSLLFFHLVDEPALQRFQSGLLRRNLSLRPAFAAVKDGIEAADTSCSDTKAWRHATRVIGARAVFDLATKASRVRVFGLTAAASEDADATAGIFRADADVPRLGDLRTALSTGPTTGAVLKTEKLIKANRAPRFEFRGTLSPGRYVYAIWMRATLNPSRTSLFRSGVFEVR
jgi:hypothetical protein